MSVAASASDHPSASAHEERRGGLRGTPWRDFLTAFLHLAALSGLALAQPLLNLLGKYPAFFAAHESTSLEVIGFGVLLVLGPPLFLVALEMLAALVSPRLRWGLHLLFVAGLATLFFVLIVRRLDTPIVVLLAALVLGVALAALYARFEALRTLLSFLALAPVLFLALFLFGSPVSKIVTGGSAKAANANAKSQPPIVLIMFDGFPVRTLESAPGRIDARRYPTFARLAREGTWYANATTAHENTIFSVPSILDGRWPDPKAEPIVQDHPDNLFSLLGKNYTMNVQEVATNLCPTGLCRKTDQRNFKGRMKLLAEDVSVVYQYLTYPKSLQERLPPIGDRWEGFRNRDTAGGGAKKPGDIIAALGSGARPAQFRKSIAAIKRSAKPQLNFNHVLLPHEPRQYLPDERQYQSGADPDPALDGPPSFANRYLTQQSYQRTMLQVQFVDKLVAELIRRLKQQGVYDETMLMLVSDHGESFQVKETPGGSFSPGKLTWRRAVTRSNIEEIAPVPLFVKYPKGEERARPGVDRRFVKTLDILPTVADQLGIDLRDVGFKVDGRSLLSSAYKGRGNVEVEKSDGKRVRMGIPEFTRRRAAALGRQLRLFGTGTDSLYRIGPHPELIGRRVADLSVGTGGGLRAQIKEGSRFKSVDPDGAVLPTHVKGTISGGPSAGRDLVFALNGEVVAAAKSFAPLGKRKLNFAVLIPDEKLRKGRNRLEVLEVQGRRLTRIGTAG